MSAYRKRAFFIQIQAQTHAHTHTHTFIIYIRQWTLLLYVWIRSNNKLISTSARVGLVNSLNFTSKLYIFIKRLLCAKCFTFYVIEIIFISLLCHLHICHILCIWQAKSKRRALNEKWEYLVLKIAQPIGLYSLTYFFCIWFQIDSYLSMKYANS